MGSIFFEIKKSLLLEKCLQPKKPLYAESGEGCTDFRIRCFLASIRVDFF